MKANNAMVEKIEVTENIEKPEKEQPGPEQDMDEAQLEYIRAHIKPIRKLEMIGFIVLVIVMLYIWTRVYKQPVPPILKRFFGMDNTVYPEMMQNRKNHQ